MANGIIPVVSVNGVIACAQMKTHTDLKRVTSPNCLSQTNFRMCFKVTMLMANVSAPIDMDIMTICRVGPLPLRGISRTRFTMH